MVHGDDQGLRLPPAVAPYQCVIVPISRKADEAEKVLAAARQLRESVEAAGVRVKLDERDGLTPGFKFNDWEMRGVPLRIEIGPRDVAAGEVVTARRDRSGPEAKQKVAIAEAPARVKSLLEEIQKSLFDQALKDRIANTRSFDNYDALKQQMAGEGGGGMAEIYWCRNPECEIRIREETRATCRAIPLDQTGAAGVCIVCGSPASERAFFAKAY
jgi:prolyl-tRNA synthetase